MGTCFFPPPHHSSPPAHNQKAVASAVQNFMLKLQQPQQSKCKSVRTGEGTALTSSSSTCAAGGKHLPSSEAALDAGLSWVAAHGARAGPGGTLPAEGGCTFGVFRAPGSQPQAAGSAGSKLCVLKTRYISGIRGISHEMLHLHLREQSKVLI